MPWVATTTSPATQGVTGAGKWFRPDANSTGTFNNIPFPANLAALDNLPSWAISTVTGHSYGCGAWTDNVVLTSDMAFWRLGLEPPVVVPLPTLVAGPGLTNNIICYWSFYDAATDEDSALSAPSATLAAVNQAIQWPTPPTPLNPRVTHVGYWRSVDGSLPRLVMRRQVGVGVVTEAIALGGLGFAFTDIFTRFPRCRYNAIWHDRHVMAGDDLNPNNIYLSLIGKPERQSTLTLQTKSGQPVVGLVVVRDTLIVLCPRASEIITGYTQDDLAIVIAQPQIGCLSHFGVQLIHGNAWIPTALGLYLCDGSSWIFLGSDLQRKWATEYRNNQSKYENAFAMNDPNEFVYGLYVGSGNPDVTLAGIASPNVFWVADWTPVVQQVGGGYSQPNWSYDTSGRVYHHSANLAKPGARRADTFLGGCDGFIYQYSGDGDDNGDTLHKRFVIRTGADSLGDEGGDLAHGKRFPEVDIFIESETRNWDLNVYAGEEQAHKQNAANNLVPNFTHNNPGSALTYPSASGAGTYTAQEKGTWHFETPLVVGQRFVIEISATVSPWTGFMEFRGYSISWKEGEAPRYPKLLVGAP